MLKKLLFSKGKDKYTSLGQGPKRVPSLGALQPMLAPLCNTMPLIVQKILNSIGAKGLKDV